MRYVCFFCFFWVRWGTSLWAQQPATIEVLTTTYTLGDFVFTVEQPPRGSCYLQVKNQATGLKYEVAEHLPIQKIYGADLDDNGSKEFLIVTSWCLHCKGLEIVSYRNNQLKVTETLFFDYMQADFEFTDLDQNGTIEVVAYESMPNINAYRTDADYVSVYAYKQDKLSKQNASFANKIEAANERILTEIASLDAQNTDCHANNYALQAKLYALMHNYKSIGKQAEGWRVVSQFYSNYYDTATFVQQLKAAFGN